MPQPGSIHLEHSDGPLAARVIPENQTAKDALEGLHATGKGIADAADDKAREYAQRILIGEDPKAMGIPKVFRKKVEEYVNAGRQESGRDESVPGVGSSGAFEMGFDDPDDESSPSENTVVNDEQAPIAEQNENLIVPPKKKPIPKVKFAVVSALGAHEKKITTRDAFGNEVDHVLKSKDVFEIEQNDFARRRLTESKDKWDPKSIEGLTGWQKFGKKAERFFDRIWRGTVTEDVHFAKEKALGTELSAIAGIDSAISEEFHAVIDKGARERLAAERKTGWEKFAGGAKDVWAELRGARKDLHKHELAITQELRQKYDADPTNSDPIENPLYALVNRDVAAREALAARVNESDLELLKQTNIGDKKTVEAIKFEGEKGKKVEDFLKKEVIGKAINDFVTRAEAGQRVTGIEGKLRREIDLNLQDYFMTDQFQDWVKTLPTEQQAMFESSFTYASDILLQTEEVMLPSVLENLDHYKGSERLNFEMELCLGTAQLSANTEAKKDGWFTKERASLNKDLMDKLRQDRNTTSKSRIYDSDVVKNGLKREKMLGYAAAIYKNEALMAWTAALTLKGASTAARAGMSWLPVLGSAGVAGTLSGLKEWGRMDKNRATYGFGIANGLEFPIADKAIKSAELRAVDYNRLQLSDRTQQFQEVLTKISDGTADANTMFMGMVYAADSQARLKLSGERNINLLTASIDGPAGRGIHARELRIHDKARAAVMGKLEGLLSNNENLNNVGNIFGMLPGEFRDFDSLMDTLTEAQYNNLLSGSTVSGPLKAAITNVDSKLQVQEGESIRLRDKLYNGMHWKSTLKHGVTSGVIAGVAGWGIGKFFHHTETLSGTENHTVVMVDHALPTHQDILPTAQIMDDHGNVLAQTHSWLPSGTHLELVQNRIGGENGGIETSYNLVTDNTKNDVLLHGIVFGNHGEIQNQAQLLAEETKNHITITPHELSPVSWDTEGGTEIDYTQWNNTLHYGDFPKEDIHGFFAQHINASLTAHPEVSVDGHTLAPVDRVTDVTGLGNFMRGMENWVYKQNNFHVNQVEGYNRALHSEDTMWSAITGHKEVISEWQSNTTDILHVPDLLAKEDGIRRVVDLIHESVRENPTGDIHHQFSDEAHRIAWEMSYWGDEAHIPDAKETFTLLEYFGEMPTAGEASSVIPVENYFTIDQDITTIVPVHTGDVFTENVADMWTHLAAVGYVHPLESPTGIVKKVEPIEPEINDRGKKRGGKQGSPSKTGRINEIESNDLTRPIVPPISIDDIEENGKPHGKPKVNMNNETNSEPKSEAQKQKDITSALVLNAYTKLIPKIREELKERNKGKADWDDNQEKAWLSNNDVEYIADKYDIPMAYMIRNRHGDNHFIVLTKPPEKNDEGTYKVTFYDPKMDGEQVEDMPLDDTTNIENAIYLSKAGGRGKVTTKRNPGEKIAEMMSTSKYDLSIPEIKHNEYMRQALTSKLQTDVGDGHNCGPLILMYAAQAAGLKDTTFNEDKINIWEQNYGYNLFRPEDMISSEEKEDSEPEPELDSYEEPELNVDKELSDAINDVTNSIYS